MTGKKRKRRLLRLCYALSVTYQVVNTQLHNSTVLVDTRGTKNYALLWSNNNGHRRGHLHNCLLLCLQPMKASRFSITCTSNERNFVIS